MENDAKTVNKRNTRARRVKYVTINNSTCMRMKIAISILHWVKSTSDSIPKAAISWNACKEAPNKLCICWTKCRFILTIWRWRSSQSWHQFVAHSEMERFRYLEGENVKRTKEIPHKFTLTRRHYAERQPSPYTQKTHLMNIHKYDCEWHTFYKYISNRFMYFLYAYFMHHALDSNRKIIDFPAVLINHSHDLCA